MIDVEVLHAAGLTHTQITAVFEAAAPLIAELDQLRAYKASRREQNRKDKQKQRSRQADRKTCQADCQADIKKVNRINDHVRLTTENFNEINDHVRLTTENPSTINGHVRLTPRDSSSYFLLDSERKKESRKCQADISFEQFWTAYPRKVGKMVAEKAFAKALEKTTVAEILAALQKQKPNLPADPKFVPHPATWLNQGRWLDEPDVARPPKFDARII